MPHGHLRTKMMRKTPEMDDHTMVAIKYVSFVRYTTVHNNNPFVVVVVVVVVVCFVHTPIPVVNGMLVSL